MYQQRPRFQPRNFHQSSHHRLKQPWFSCVRQLVRKSNSLPHTKCVTTQADMSTSQAAGQQAASWTTSGPIPPPTPNSLSSVEQCMRVAVVVIVKRLRRAANLLIGNSFETTFHIQCRRLRRRRLPKVRLQRHHNERRQPHNDRRDSAQQSGGSPSFRIRKVFAAA